MSPSVRLANIAMIDTATPAPADAGLNLDNKG
jgi:hypothetical protein